MRLFELAAIFCPVPLPISLSSDLSLSASVSQSRTRRPVPSWGTALPHGSISTLLLVGYHPIYNIDGSEALQVPKHVSGCTGSHLRYGVR